MSLLVQKYGGTSVGTVERIQAVAEKVAKSHRLGNQLVVAVSAMSGETNRLIGLAKAIDPEPCLREMDVLVSTGEQVTIALLCLALKKAGVEARSYTGGQV
jgi:aspartate kinase